VPKTWDPYSLDPEAAKQRLIEGNRRFRDGTPASLGRSWDPTLANAEQRPFAIVLGCSDARTPVEIVFDQGYGDLFVVRAAGNIVAPSIVGSIEFAASQFGTRLVVVMGHSRCGAVTATLTALAAGNASSASRNIRSITDRIAPHVEHLARTTTDHTEIIPLAVKANVSNSVDFLRHGSRMLEELVLAGRVVVTGAVYELETGTVRFFE
jgi:carbonic anhydrase